MSRALRDLVVVGAGGHGREIVAAIRALNTVEPTWNLLGVVDDAASDADRLDRIGLHLLGDLSWLEQHPTCCAIGIGTSSVRWSVAQRLSTAGADFATIVHPGAWIGPDVRLGDGVVVFDRCTLTTNIDIGDQTHLNVGCAVQHDSVVGRSVQFSPGVFVNGDCTIGDGVFLGTGAIVTRGHTVGPAARVGAGAVVLDDVAEGTTVVGTPARPTTGPAR